MKIEELRNEKSPFWPVGLCWLQYREWPPKIVGLQNFCWILFRHVSTFWPLISDTGDSRQQGAVMTLVFKTKNGNMSYLFPIRVCSWLDCHKSPCLIKNQNKTFFGWFPLVSGCCFAETDLFSCCCTFHLFSFIGSVLLSCEPPPPPSLSEPYCSTNHPSGLFHPTQFFYCSNAATFSYLDFPTAYRGQSARLATFPSTNYASWTHLIPFFFSWCWQSWVPLFSCACNLDHSTKSRALAALSSRMK